MKTTKRTRIGQLAVICITQLFQAQKRSNKTAKRTSESIDAITSANEKTAFLLAFIVVLLMLNFILRFPDLGAIIAEYNRF
jgi:cell division protein FtsW (lipid II flippase)